MALSEAKPRERDVEGAGRVALGVAMTIGAWACIPRLGSLAFAVNAPFVIAVVVSLAGRAVPWSVRTLKASVLTLAATTVVSDAFYLRDRTGLWSFWTVVVFDLLAVGATWLAWKGGLIIAGRHRGGDRDRLWVVTDR